MHLPKNIESVGYFWLPESADVRLPGTLRIAQSGEAKLELIGHFGDIKGALNGKPSAGRIVGLLENGDPVLLERCLYLNRTFSMNGLSKQVIRAQLVLIGVGADGREPDEALMFSRLRFSVDGLDEWVGISGITRTFDLEGPSIKIEYQAPSEQSVLLDSGLGFSVVFESTFPDSSLTEAKVTQRAYIQLSSSDPQELDFFLSALVRVSHLLTFAMNEAVSVTSIVAYSPQVRRDATAENARMVPIKVIYEGRVQSAGRSRVNTDKMLFSFGQVQQSIKRVMDSWLANYDVAEPAFNLYFASKTGQHSYLESRFLALAQAIETLHRRKYPGTAFPSGEYEDLCKHLLNSCPEDRRQWLENRLRYGDEPTLRARITRLIAPYRRYYDNARERKRLVGAIVNTRNYLTHYDPALEAHATHGSNLYTLCMRVEALFELHLLGGLGLSHDEIDQIVGKNRYLKYRMHGRALD